ncbi:ubiquitin-like domain-containing CTD phosphatase 1 isoform X1 [Carassius auratus]|uniref:Ubiquitin-like domain-containing CTD phosphatase 1 isoform X1 n=1 Tax=Carassius auratus TaxID=7957 RepID=A0A6P6P284_CARAU|nr:ubiquitin-like domain-containing CTD phosphatase 1 isoform X1 [Carassius auratus]
MRPYLHEFLTSAYEDYDIVIWSATSMKWIDAKMKELGVTDNPNYKITFMLDNAAMITVHTLKRGVVEVKPLGVIWDKYSEFYNRKNTIMFDDIGRNFLMNPQNGLKVPFKEAESITSSALRRICCLERFGAGNSILTKQLLVHRSASLYLALSIFISL